MRLTDDDAILWGAMMFAAGYHLAQGRPVIALSVIDRETIRQAKEVATKEWSEFRRKIKERRDMPQRGNPQ